MDKLISNARAAKKRQTVPALSAEAAKLLAIASNKPRRDGRRQWPGQWGWLRLVSTTTWRFTAERRAGGRQDRGGNQSSSASGRQLARVANDPNDPGVPQPKHGRVRLQPDAKFPLRYRDLVGEYSALCRIDRTRGNDETIKLANFW